MKTTTTTKATAKKIVTISDGPGYGWGWQKSPTKALDIARRDFPIGADVKVSCGAVCTATEHRVVGATVEVWGFVA